MGTFFVFFIIAVVAWAIVSLVMLYVWESKKGEEQKAKGSNAGKVAEDPHTRDSEKVVPNTQAASTESKFGQMAGGADIDWRQQLKQMPGVLGWLLIDTEGDLLQASDVGFVAAAESDPTIRKIVTLISQLKPEVGDNSLRLMEWEGPQGQVLVAFPEEAMTPERLVLFLDTETFKNQMRDMLSQLKWDSQSQAEFAR